MVNTFKQVKQERRTSGFYKKLARFGCMATAVVYMMLGVFAMLSLLRLKQGGADEASLLKFLEHVPLGKVVIALILLGMLAYIVWRFYEAIRDPYDYGSKTKGITIRLLTAFSAVSDALIGWPALQSLIGISTASEGGQPTAQREMIGGLLQNGGGPLLVGAIGVITTITAITQLVYVFREAYEERIDFKELPVLKRKIIHTLSYAGHIARGIILGIMGFFLLKAAIVKDAQHVVNTDKAFDFIGDEISPIAFALVAIGTICYGLFMLAMGYYYDFRKGK